MVTAEGDWVGDFMMSLSKSMNFDMTLMFCEKEDHEYI